MSAEPMLAHPTAQLASGLVRVEYRGFQSVAGYREYRLAVFGPAGPVEYRFRIPTAAFDSGQVRLQDGPDLCYQRLLRAVAADATAGLDGVTIDDVELAAYREAHRQAPKHPSLTHTSLTNPSASPRTRPRSRPSQLSAATPAATDVQATFDVGQRVSHAVFGAGVTASSTPGHTIVQFDDAGLRTFVTSMLELEALSPPHTWETGPRGHNRPREANPAQR